MDSNDDAMSHSRALFLENSSSLPIEPSTPSPANGTNTTNNSWLGLDSTQILIIFLIIVFAVLILFLFVYYYIIKSMRPKSAGKNVPKSASGSSNDDKGRNIFAQPERQMAVDQSGRHPPPRTSEPDQSSGQATAPTVVVPSQGNQTQPPSATVAKPSGSEAPPQAANPQLSKKSSSSGRARERGKPAPSVSSEPAREEGHHDHHTVVGALAGLRDTLRETR